VLLLLLVLMMMTADCVTATGSNSADVWYTQLILVLQVILYLNYVTHLVRLRNFIFVAERKPVVSGLLRTLAVAESKHG